MPLKFGARKISALYHYWHEAGNLGHLVLGVYRVGRELGV